MKGDPPHVLAGLQPGDPVAPGLNEGRLYPEQPPWHSVEIDSGLVLHPGMHVIHRRQRAVYRCDIQPGRFVKKLPIPANESRVDVQIALRARTQAIEILVLKRILEWRTHTGSLATHPKARNRRLHPSSSGKQQNGAGDE